MKKLWVASLVTGLAITPFIASADVQAQLNDLQRQIDQMNDQAVGRSRGISLRGPEQFGIGSDIYNEELYIHDFGLNKDVNLLHERYFINTQMGGFQNVPRVLVSGKLGAKIGKHSDTFGNDASDHENFIKGNAEIDFTAYANEDWMGYLQIEGDGNGTTANRASANATVSIDQVFITYGNLEKLPVYATLGYQYVPFGSYITEQITSSLVQDLGRTKAPAALGGYEYRNGTWDVNAAGFLFDGDTKTSDNFRLDEWGANLQARKTDLGPNHDYIVSGGMSYINNIASSNGISDDVSDAGITKLNHYVPALDVRGKVAKGPWSLWAEYLTATRNFKSTEFTQTRTGHSANAIEPSAFHIESAYNFRVWDIPQTVALSYDYTHEALAFNLPKTQYAVGYQLTPFKNTKVTAEYARKQDYDKDETVTMANGSTFVGTDRLDEVFQVQLNVYF